ncbi:MAG: NAD-dependent protein deacetylase [Cryobacterium sp.]|nr:NAD-dependent protein deacetylase [Cryobacterium sp.]
MDQIDHAAALLRGGRFAILTGAGMSTDSGIPDYRGPDSPKRTPMTYQEFIGDETRRRHYWARNHVGYRHMRSVEPNEGHRVVARLEALGLALGVITQNVDLLHERAGSNNVIDLHGRTDAVVCLQCQTKFPRAYIQLRLDIANPDFDVSIADVEIAPDADAVLAETETFNVPACEVCGGILKPDVVFFGENVPRHRVEKSYAMVDQGSALLVLGSSLTVASGLRFVNHAARTGKPILIVNRGETRGDSLADLKLETGTTEFLLGLERELS